MIDDKAIIDSGSQTLERQIKGLESLKLSLNQKFVDIVKLISGLEGRLIISGMGKSGHIATKIAATLASTGTPAHFVHPGEASHGDLGMITQKDAVFLLSNSGETKELEDIIGYCHRFTIPIIGLARREASMLIDASTIGVALPEVPEQSLTGAPTTSTTMMLAYGDAVAMAVLDLKGFTKEDFGVFHPGGKLGSGLLRAEKLMHRGEEMPLVNENSFMKDAIIEITSKAFGCTGVLSDNGKLIGVVTDGDIRRHIDKSDMINQKVVDIMTKTPKTVPEKIFAAEALKFMNDNNISAIFAVENGKPVGILHLHDCLRAGL